MKRIGIAGKGGSGKTTISGTLARLSARASEHEILAIDGDPNPNLETVLGISRETPWPLLPRDLLTHDEQEDGKRIPRLTLPISEIFDKHSVLGPDGVRLLALGEVEGAGQGMTVPSARGLA